MKFCNSLMRDINFEPDFIQPCCDVRGVNKVPQFPFSGGKLNMQEYADYITNIFPAIQKGEMCKNCPNLVDISTENYDFLMKFDTVSINVNRYLCNCKCTYCSLWKKPAVCHYDLRASIESLFDNHMLSKKCYFSWGGGEPSIFNQFEEISDFISQKGHYQYVHTNAIIYSKTFEKILHNKLGKINISLDSGTPQKYKQIKGVDKFVKVVENIKNYRLACRDPFQIDLKYIIFEQNNELAEIEKFIRLCHALDIKSIEFSFDFREVNKNKVSNQSLYAAKYLMVLAKQADIHCEPFFVTEEYQNKILNATL